MYIDIKNEKIIGIYADNKEGLIDVGIIPSPEEIPGKNTRDVLPERCDSL